MKKICFGLVVIIALSLVLSSCEIVGQIFEPKSGIELWERVSNKMASLDSYVCDVNATISLSVNDIEFDGSITGETVIVGLQKGELFVYEYANSEISSVEADFSQTTSSVIGYDGGNIYLYNKQNKESKKLFSSITKEEFITYYFDNSSIDISPDNCENLDFSKNDDGSYELRYSGFRESDINEITGRIGFDSFSLGVVITDIRVSVFIDKEYRVNEMKVDFLIETGEKPLSMNITYSAFNSAKKRVFDKDEYIKVDDVRIINHISRELNEALLYRTGIFTLDVSHKLKDKKGVLVDKYEERDTISYRIKDGKYTYKISAITSDQNIEIEYADGTQKTYVKGNYKGSTTQTETEARAYIAALMNSAGYSPIYVYDVKCTSDNVYKLYCKVNDTSSYRSIMSSVGDIYLDYTICFTATLDDDGDLDKLECELIIRGSRYDYTVYTIVDITD